jgi:hypothetical protein
MKSIAAAVGCSRIDGNICGGLVPLAGLEPARCCHHLILSQARLPIPPQGQGVGGFEPAAPRGVRARIILAERQGSTGECGYAAWGRPACTDRDTGPCQDVAPRPELQSPTPIPVVVVKGGPPPLKPPACGLRTLCFDFGPTLEPLKPVSQSGLAPEAGLERRRVKRSQQRAQPEAGQSACP